MERVNGNPEVSEAERVCRRCHTSYFVSFFGGVSLVCRGCRQKADHAASAEVRLARRIKVKITNALHSHARSLSALRGQKLTAETLVQRYGWEPDQMERQIREALDHGGCPYCWRKFCEIAADVNGQLAAVTFDVHDRTVAPYFDSNVRVCCDNCNKRKSKLSPDRWGQDTRMWRRWRKAQENGDGAEALVTHQLPLFEETEP